MNVALMIEKDEAELAVLNTEPYFDETGKIVLQKTSDVLRSLANVPAVRRVTDARWMRTDTGTTCEACGGAALLDDDGQTVLSTFCPHCGANMRR